MADIVNFKKGNNSELTYTQSYTDTQFNARLLSGLYCHNIHIYGSGFNLFFKLFNRTIGAYTSSSSVNSAFNGKRSECQGWLSVESGDDCRPIYITGENGNLKLHYYQIDRWKSGLDLDQNYSSYGVSDKVMKVG